MLNKTHFNIQILTKFYWILLEIIGFSFQKMTIYPLLITFWATCNVSRWPLFIYTLMYID